MGGAGVPLGLEWAGEIVEVGGKVTGHHVGDRVMGAGQGAFAEYIAANAKRIHAVPDGMAFTQAAAFPVALQTMHDAIATAGRLTPGQSVMIQGASSGVGIVGMQVARMPGMRSITWRAMPISARSR